MKKRIEQLAARAREELAALAIPDVVVERREPCILFTCHDVDRGLQQGGRYFSPILTPISEHCQRRGKAVVNLTHPLTVYASRQVYGGTVSVNRGYLLCRRIQQLETLAMGRKRARVRGKARRIALYRKVLEKLKPERIFSIQPPHDLCSAAHELGIPVIEAMHGMNLHPTDKIFTGLFQVDDHMLPSTFLTFDARTQATLARLLEGRPMRAVQLPHPWHVEVHRERSTLRADSAELDAVVRRFRAAILVTLQWGYAGERASLAGIIPNGVMHPALRDAIASSPKDVLWLVRLHPIQIKRKRYAAHRAYAAELARKHDNVETTLASSLPLPLLMSRVSGHITMISGAAGEAALLGVPSLLLCPTLKPGGAHAGWFTEIIETGMAALGELDAGEITNWVNARLERPAFARDRDWQRDAAELERGLDALLAGDPGAHR